MARRRRKNSKNSNQANNYEVCVICSTQNQMINYIPLKLEQFNFETIYNITITGSNYFENGTWDKNLKNVLSKEFEDIKIEQTNTHSVSKILENKELEKLQEIDGKIFWNITGGQRTILLSIMKIIKSSDKRKDDVICYLEGNNNQIYISDINHKNPKAINYSQEKFDLDIVKALKLGGFKISESSSDTDYLDDDILEKFISLYEDRDNKLRELLIETNKSTTEQEALNKLKHLDISRNKLEQLNISKQDAVKKIFEVIEWGYKKNKSTPFGYILEEMTRYIISQSIDNIQELKTNVRLYNSEKIEDVNNTQIDEFDVLLLTKNGKLIVFECKSGSMHPDIAKSTKYSTYAVSGVYGLPILITPLLKEEIPPSDKFKDLGDKYSDIKASVSSALRSSLKVWGLDEIEEKLKKYIEL